MLAERKIFVKEFLKMAKGYEDLSRRALIKLGKDFDQENDAALMQYLAEHSNEYENIRFVEKCMVKADTIAQSLKGSKSIIKDVLISQSDKIIDTVVNAVVTVADDAEKGLSAMASSTEESELVEGATS